jgi:hypothetical protein
MRAMASKFHVTALTLAAVAWGGALASAQSLGDIARQEEARRKEIKQPAKVYTNKDLGDVPFIPPPDDSKAAADTKSGTAAATTPSEGAKDAKDTSKDKPRDQAYWSGRSKDLDAQLSRDQTFADALQTRINALTADFSARDNPIQREQIGRDRQKAMDELDRLKKTIQADKKAIADFQEEARRAAVPPGWLR